MRSVHDLPKPDPAWFVRPDGRDGSIGIHGIAHTTRVMIHASEIARAVRATPLELESVLLAALWHDIGRTHDGRDDLHGAKSAGKVAGLQLHRGVRPAVVETALFAVTYHSGPEDDAAPAAKWLGAPEAGLRVFEILKDADGLDRVRLGDLDVRYLRLPPSPGRVERAHELLREIPERRRS